MMRKYQEYMIYDLYQSKLSKYEICTRDLQSLHDRLDRLSCLDTVGEMLRNH